MKLTLDERIKKFIEHPAGRDMKKRMEILGECAENGFTVSSIVVASKMLSDINSNMSVFDLLQLKYPKRQLKNIYLNFWFTSYASGGIEIFVEPYFEDEKRVDLEFVKTFMNKNSETIYRAFAIISNEKYKDLYKDDWYWYFANR